MDLLPTDEQDEIVASVRSVLAARFPTTGFGPLDGADDVVDPAAWAQVAELGWFALGLPESAGGVGYSVVEEALVATEIGASLAPGPFLAQVVAVHVAHGAGAGADELTAGLAAGTTRAAWGTRAPEWDRLVIHHLAGADVVVEVDPAGARLWSVADLADVRSDESLDLLTPMSTAALPVGSPTAEWVGPDAFTHATILAAATAAGLARGAAEQSVAYALDREQFGQPIGGFQAVKHRCADMAVRADGAVQQTRLASLVVRDAGADAALQAAAAHLVATRAAIENAQVNVQNHGGIGFTWEHTAHRFVTRARLVSLALGDTAARTAALLDTGR